MSAARRTDHHENKSGVVGMEQKEHCLGRGGYRSSHNCQAEQGAAAVEKNNTVVPSKTRKKRPSREIQHLGFWTHTHKDGKEGRE